MEEQMRENQEKLNDPVFQLQQQELQLEAADLERKAQTDTAQNQVSRKDGGRTFGCSDSARILGRSTAQRKRR
jgi:hypothetical protein